MHNASHLSLSQSNYIESLYKSYLESPDSVPEQWKLFFDGMKFALEKYPEAEENTSTTGVFDPKVSSEEAENEPDPELPDYRKGSLAKQIGVLNLINAYRTRGHLISRTNPVRKRKDHRPYLNLENFGLDETDLDKTFQAGHEIGIGEATLRKIRRHLRETYCKSVGVEYMHMRKPQILAWLQKKLESTRSRTAFSIEEKQRILEKLNDSEVFEKFLQTRYQGQKRFSLEGAEVLIPALEELIYKGVELSARHFIIGMAHRGRLNVLANILGKTYQDIFSEFEDYTSKSVQGSGDVKYHKGYSTIREINSETVKLNLGFNPSHLEAVDTVIAGMARAKTEQWFAGDTNKIIPILIHGDAAIAGQGIVYEHMQLSQLPGYHNGGTIHIVVNNQIGFTTDFTDGRSTIYCTDIGKTTFSPIFHVNGHDPEAVVHVMRLATEFRQKYKRDVYIDIVCFRKYGHNETDEPRFTQPYLYKLIEQLPSVREAYSKQLAEAGVIESQLAGEMENKFKNLLQERMQMAQETKKASVISALQSKWSGIRFSRSEDFEQSPTTGVPHHILDAIISALTSIPADFDAIPKVLKLLEERSNQFAQGQINWALAELLAYGSLLLEQFPIRLSGQDVQRGTFSHRHAVLRDQSDESKYHLNLNHIADQQEKIQIWNSPLSEYGVLGFEYGFSLSTPRALTIWEAQFGDFTNGAQIIIDQFISSAEEKWLMCSGIVLLLPHGYEGQGPEHSSARVERFLQLCAQDNMQIVNCTTPANFFHMMRRQMIREFRKPLIVFTPKSLLRHPECVSDVKELEQGCFQEILDDPTATSHQTTRVLWCTGKIYYDLLKYKREKKQEHVAIVRMEQIYPIAHKQIKAIMEKYKGCKEWYWVQEEPINMGPWDFIKRNFRARKLKVISRPEMASPAEGSTSRAKSMQHSIVEACFKN
jgi:2-oxoglutarate dehydrogenase E1 component